MFRTFFRRKSARKSTKFPVEGDRPAAYKLFRTVSSFKMFKEEEEVDDANNSFLSFVASIVLLCAVCICVSTSRFMQCVSQ